MEKYKKFLVLWLVNTVLLYLAPKLMPGNYTLGSSSLSPIQSAVIMGFIWNWVLWHTGDYLKEFEIKLKGALPMMLIYLGVNFALLWLIARFAVITSFGVSSYMYVLLLAAVANFIQYLTWQAMDKRK